MSNLDAVWGNTQADAPTEDNPPPVGPQVPQVYEFKAFTSKQGEFTVVVGFQTDTHRWSDVRVLTQNRVPQEGRIKACKIMLRQLGINPDTPPAQLEHIGSQVVGRYYAVDIVDSGRVRSSTGEAILNTNITGPASAPTMNVAPAAPAPTVQVPHAQAAHFGSAAAAFPMPGEPAPQPVAMTQAEVDRSNAIQVPQAQPVAQPQQPAPQPGAAVFPSAVPGQPPTVVQQQPAPGAQFGDTPPWQ